MKVTDLVALGALDIACRGEDALPLVQKDHHHDILHDASDDWQIRQMQAGRAVPVAHSMKNPNADPVKVGGVGRPPVVRR